MSMAPQGCENVTDEMIPAAARRGWRRFVPLRFCRDEKGHAAVEFAIVAPAFFFLMFVIAETALVFIAEQVMDNAVFESARLIRTGQVQNGGMSDTAFTADVCGRMSVFIDCDDGDFFLDVKSYESFEAMNAALASNAPIDAETEEFKSVGAFDFGEESEIVVVRAYYQWPTNKVFGMSLKNLSNGKRLMGSFAAFRNEPYGPIETP
jgi:Flp pilus assembly protein TadG